MGYVAITAALFALGARLGRSNVIPGYAVLEPSMRS
jgi:hypothetical protein